MRRRGPTEHNERPTLLFLTAANHELSPRLFRTLWRQQATFALFSGDAKLEELRAALSCAKPDLWLVGRQTFERRQDLFFLGLSPCPVGVLEAGSVTLLETKQPAAPLPSLLTRAPRRALSTLFFTSGSTGEVKACYRGPDPDFSYLRLTIRGLDLRRSDHYLCATPLYHSGPARFVLAYVLLGAKITVHDSFDPERVWRSFDEEAITTTFLVPTQLRALLHLPAKVLRRRPAALRRVFVAGSRVFPEEVEQFNSLLGRRVVVQFYGATEYGTVTALWPEDPWEEGNVGRPLPGVEVRLRNGEVFVRSASCLDGYLRRGRLVSPRTREGFLSIGDQGFLDDRGYLHLLGRKGELMITGGVNVYPAQIERAALRHPHVREVVAFARPDPYWGDRVCCAYASNPFLPPAELKAFLRRHLLGPKIPKDYFALAQIPRTPTNKPDRRRVIEMCRGACPDLSGPL